MRSTETFQLPAGAARRSALGALAAGVAAVALPARVARAHEAAAGTEFKAVATPQPVEAPAGKVEVVEFFGYWCPHCNALESDLQAWRARQPADVAFRKVPVAFRPNQAPLQHTYHALDAMGKVDAISPALFAAIHGERRSLDTVDAIADVVAKAGGDRARFVELVNSFAVQAKSRRGSQLAEGYGIDGVPTLGIAGRWLTSPSMAGGKSQSLHVLDELIARERRARR